LFGNIHNSHPRNIAKIRVLWFIQREVAGGSDTLAKEVNLSSRTEQSFEAVGFLLRILPR